MNVKEINQLPPRIILWGGTGQAKLVRPIIEHYGAKVAVVFDDTPGLLPPFPDVKIYCGKKEFLEWITTQQNRGGIGFCITIGNPHGRVRLALHDWLVKEGLMPVSVVHATAFIAENATVGSGAQILAGAVIAPEVQMGRECIINANASVDHECVLEDAVEIGPGATLCGVVRVGVNTWVGAGATVLPQVKIGADAIVGAGAVVTRDVPDGATVVGVPAKPMERKKGDS